jgi:hypothetical protein
MIASMAGEPDPAASRRRWPARVFRRGEQPPDDDLSASTSRQERLQMMWELAEAAWSLARRPIPSYGRSEMPARVIRPVSR